jgi:hypothetical protein
MFSSGTLQDDTSRFSRWSFDEGTGNSSADTSGWGRNLTVTSDVWISAGGWLNDEANTLKMTGASKNINYTGDETIGHLHIDAGQTTLNNLSVTDGTDTFTCSSVTIDSGTTFTSTAGTLLIIDETDGGYAFDNSGGTYNHNDGLLKFDFAKHTYVRANTLGNVEINMDASHWEIAFRDHTGGAVEILGNLTITQGVFDSQTVTDSFTIHGNTYTAANGAFFNDGNHTGPVIHHGLVTNLGTYRIKDGETHHMNGGFRQLGTFTTP